jgi:hypothetical protein
MRKIAAEEKTEAEITSPFAKDKKAPKQKSGPAKMRSTHVSTMPPAQNLFGRLVQTMNVANTQNVRDHNPGWDIYAAAKRASKVEKVMGEYKRGKLRSGSKTGPKVKSRDQAIAIALSEAREAGEDVPEKKSEVKNMKVSEFRKIAAKITAEKRESLPKSDFGLKNKADTKKEKAQSGNYPIDTKGRARAALAYSKRYATPGQQVTIKQRVEAKYPGMGVGGEEGREAKAEFAYCDGFFDKLSEAGIEKEAFLPLLLAAGAPFAAGAGYGALKNLFRRGQRLGSGAVDLPFNVAGNVAGSLFGGGGGGGGRMIFGPAGRYKYGSAYNEGMVEKLAEAGFTEKEAQGFMESLGERMMAVPRWIGQNPGKSALGAMAMPFLAPSILGAGLMGRMFPKKQTMWERLRGGASDLGSQIRGLF